MEQTNLCEKCGAPMAMSKLGKPYCSAKCWLPKEQADLPMNNVPQAALPVVSKEQGISEVRHIFQNDYEFGPPGNRHKIRYFKHEELLQQLEVLKNSGLMDSE